MKSLKWIILASILLVGVSLMYKITRPAPTVPLVLPKSISLPPPAPPNIEELSKDVNQARADAGEQSLVLSDALNHSASDKCADMVARNYWSHDTPDGNPPWVFIQRYTRYQAAGENLEYGPGDSQEVVTAWLKSPEHKANMLNPIYTNEGFGICTSPNYIGKGRETIVVEHFTE